jgi:peptide/nickel transport system substrate-binding protein
MTFAKNTNYWQTGKPYLDGIQVTFFKDLQSMVVSLEAGAVDIITVPPRQDFARLKADPKYQAMTHPNSGNWYVLGVNTTVPPFDNKLVRQALNYAIDRQRFVNTVLLGIGTVQDLPWSEGSPAYEPAKMSAYSFDLAKARALLDQAGVSNATTDFLPLPGLPEGSEFAQIYQANLAEIGIKVNIVSMDSAAWLAAVNQRQYQSLYFANTSGADKSPATPFSQSRAFDPKNNNSGFQDDTYTQLVASAAAEANPAEAKQLYSKLNDIILDQSFSIPMGPQIITKIATSNVRDIQSNMHAGWLYTTTWLGA